MVEAFFIRFGDDSR